MLPHLWPHGPSCLDESGRSVAENSKDLRDAFLPWIQSANTSLRQAGSQQLLRELRGLKTPWQHCAASACSWQSITPLGIQANLRAARADAAFWSHDTKEHRSTNPFTLRSQIGEDNLSCSEITFEDVLSRVEAALEHCGGGQQQEVRLLRPNEPVSGMVPARGIRHYKIELPSKPAQVTVALNKISGIAPLLWGSVSTERPSPKSHDFKGKDGRLVYKHSLPPRVACNSVDRLRDAPDCQDLFVTVRAELGDCSYDIGVTFGRVKLHLTRNEFAMQVQKNRSAIEARLAGLKSEPTQREQFEKRLLEIRESAQRPPQAPACTGEALRDMARYEADMARRRGLERLRRPQSRNM